MFDTYKTINGSSEAQYRVMASKHLAFAFHVKSETEIKAILDQLWKNHHNATHICYSWRLGWEKKHHRINDDGEPSGTAGKPIYGQILSFDLTNILFAVVRYFGGTKLGTGGLIDAYKTATKLALESATIIEKPVMDHFRLCFSHASLPQVMKTLKEMEMEKLSSNFSSECEMEFILRMDKKEMLEKEMTNWNDAKLIHLGRM